MPKKLSEAHNNKAQQKKTNLKKKFIKKELKMDMAVFLDIL